MVLEHFSETSKQIVSACGIAGSDLATIQSKKLGNATIVGDFTTDCRNSSLFAHKVAAVAAAMTEHILNTYHAND